MAEICPQLSEAKLNGLDSKAEGYFYRACRDQLPPHLLVFHSIESVRLSQSGSPQDREADFVIFDPHDGFVVIEIKGGGIRYEPSEGKWYSINADGEINEIKDPFQQSRDEKYAILEILTENPKWQTIGIGRIVAGHGVFFPDLSDLAILVSPKSPPEIIGGRKDLENLSVWVEGIIHYWQGQNPTYQPLKRKGIQLVKDLFAKRIEARPLISAKIEEDEITHKRFTRQQSWVLDNLEGRTRAKVQGGAGTGKTLLAVEQARRLADKEFRCLLLCYNKPLGEHLRYVIGDDPRILATHFHNLCLDWIKLIKERHGRNLEEEVAKQYVGEDRYDVHLPFALANASDLIEDRFDAIIIDEGQDFRENYWLPIELLLKHDKESLLYVFYDHNQALYEKDLSIPIDDIPLRLTINCRNTKTIHDAAYRYYDGPETKPPGLVGVPIEIISAPSISAQAKRLHSLIVNLVAEEKVSPEKMVVLIAGNPKDVYYRELLALFNLPGRTRYLIETHHKPDTVVVDTAKRFKGLEASIVFLWGVERIAPEDYKEISYTAMTRAKSYLYLVGTDEACKKMIEARIEQ